MKTLIFPRPDHLDLMTNRELEDSFCFPRIFQKDQILLMHAESERAIAGGACPTGEVLELLPEAEMRAEYFCQRRELGIINVGGAGSIKTETAEYRLEKLEALYLGRGTKKIRFSSDDAKNPAKYYLLSYPAHQDHPSRKISKSEANILEMGSSEDSNKRTIHQFILPTILPTCQLVMGLTILAPGSVWNTMPAHTHARRTEVYMYFDLPEEHRVLHLMGEPSNTKHIVLENESAVFSPTWSIHSGCGTHAYSFIWGMGGENQDYTDMDFVAMEDLG